MKEEKPESTKPVSNESSKARHNIRLPGFLVENEIGLGQAIKKVSYAMGIKPCAGCEQRAAKLDSWVRFSR
jgi:hypothetical protein